MGESVQTQGEPHSRATIISSLLLALSHSKLAPLAKDDSLRALMQVEYADYAGREVLDLQLLWEILAEFPAFDAAAADGPMCVIKTWEERYRMPVQLPEHLRDLPEKDVARHTTGCQVSALEVAKVFERKARRESLRISVETAAPLQSQEITWRDRREVAIAAAIVCVLALGFVGYSVVSSMTRGGWSKISTADVTSAIPLKKAEKFGDEVAGTLADDEWLKGPQDGRRAAMRETLEGLSAENVRVFILMDSKQRVRATATWFDDPPRVAVRFR